MSKSAINWAEHAKSELSRAGHRAGGAREEVLSLLAEQSCCLSAQEIFDRLRAAETSRTVGLASVYRALDLLTQLKLVHRLDVGGTAVYEPAHATGEHHHHFICDACGQIAAFEDDHLEAALDQLATRLGFHVAEHDVVLRGTCSNC